MRVKPNRIQNEAFGLDSRLRNFIDIEKEQIPDSGWALIDLPLAAKRENAGSEHLRPKKKFAYLFPYKFSNFENQNLRAYLYVSNTDYFLNISMSSSFRFELRLMLSSLQQMLSIV